MFKRQKKRPAVEVPTNLIGCWHLVPTGKPDEEPSELEFREDGTLLYSIEAKDRWQIMRLTYRVEGAELVTDQPSAPHEERTLYTISPAGELELDFAGERSRYAKGEKRAPTV